MKHTTHRTSTIRMSIPIISTLVIALVTAGLWAADGVWKAPSFRARKKNPVPADAQSIAAGKTLYVQECLSCHGSSGKGDGPAAKDLDKLPGDLSSPGVADQSDGALFWKISTGRAPMPTFKDLTTEDQRWQVVNYIRTLASRVPVTTPRYDAPAPYRQAVSSVIDPYLALVDHLAGVDPDVPADQAQALAAKAGVLVSTELTDLPEAARQPWQELTRGLVQSAQEMEQAKDTDAARLRLKNVSDSLTRLVEAFGHAGKEPLILIHCEKSFDQAGASWVQTEGRPHNPYVESDKDRDCGRVVARLAAEVGNGS